MTLAVEQMLKRLAVRRHAASRGCANAARPRSSFDKHLQALAKVAERAVVVEKGRTVWTGSTAQLAADRDVHDRFLSV